MIFINKVTRLCRDSFLCEKSPLKATDYLLLIFIGAGLYGFSIGLWRGERQAVFNFIKFPLLIMLTTYTTSLLNWMIAQLLGLQLSFNNAVKAMLKSYAVFSIIVGSLSTVSLFILINTPALIEGGSVTPYRIVLLLHVLFIAGAGIIGNIRMYQDLPTTPNSKALGKLVLSCWILAHLLTGSQYSWNLRPFFGSPLLPTQFIRPNAFEGSFFEAVYNTISEVTNSQPGEHHE